MHLHHSMRRVLNQFQAVPLITRKLWLAIVEKEVLETAKQLATSPQEKNICDRLRSPTKGNIDDPCGTRYS